MKKSLFLLVLTLCVTVLFSSCLDLMSAVLDSPQTHKIVLDEYSPADQNVTLTYTGSLMLKRWNGSNVMDIMFDRRSISTTDNIILTIPAGNNNFFFDVYIILDKTTSYTSYRVPNVELRYLLETGKKYQIKTRAKSLGGSKGYEFFMGIYDVTKRSVLLEEWKIGDHK